MLAAVHLVSSILALMRRMWWGCSLLASSLASKASALSLTKHWPQPQASPASLLPVLLCVLVRPGAVLHLVLEEPLHLLHLLQWHTPATGTLDTRLIRGLKSTGYTLDF